VLRQFAYREGMRTLLVILLVAWLAVAVVGFVIKGLLWLAIIGIVLFLITGIVGMVRSRASKNP